MKNKKKIVFVSCVILILPLITGCQEESEEIVFCDSHSFTPYCNKCQNCPYIDTSILSFKKREEGYVVSGLDKESKYLYVKDVYIPEFYNEETVYSISYKAFSECFTITSLHLPNSITTISNLAFADSIPLTSIYLSNTLISIGEYAFSNCSSLTEIFLPKSIKNIGIGAFRKCDRLTIRCEAKSKPAYWSTDWNGNCPVVWGASK